MFDKPPLISLEIKVANQYRNEFVAALLTCGVQRKTAVYLFGELKRFSPMGVAFLIYDPGDVKVKKLAKRFGQSHKRYRFTESLDVGGNWTLARVAKIS